MDSESLVDDFSGSRDEYIQFLEGIAKSLRRHHQHCELSSAERSTPTIESSLETGGASTRKRHREFEVIQSHGYQIPHNFHLARPTKRLRRWQAAAKVLIENTPKAKDWYQALKEKGIYDIMNSGGVVKFLLDTSYDPSAVTRPTVTETNSLIRIREYAMATAQRMSAAFRALVLANFQKFLVLCACTVLKETGVPEQDVLDIVRLCIGQTTATHCWRMLGVVVYLNKLIEKLSQNGWGHRAGAIGLVNSYYCVSISPQMKCHK
ncbi:hypothetical protein Q7P35_008902 [Cladosporium inversicolor]